MSFKCWHFRHFIGGLLGSTLAREVAACLRLGFNFPTCPRLGVACPVSACRGVGLHVAPVAVQHVLLGVDQPRARSTARRFSRYFAMPAPCELLSCRASPGAAWWHVE